MNVLYYKIKAPVDIESLSDQMAGYPASIRVTPDATIEIDFDSVVADDLRERISTIMLGIGAEPVPAMQ